MITGRIILWYVLNRYLLAYYVQAVAGAAVASALGSSTFKILDTHDKIVLAGSSSK